MPRSEESDWRAGCSESCTPGSEGGPRKSASRRGFGHVWDVARLGPTRHVDQLLDLNELVRADVGTYYFRAEGESMTGIGIFPGDVLVVKRGMDPRSGDIVIAALDGEFTVKRYVRRGRQAWLVPENEAFASIEVLPGHELVVYGVVTHAVHTFRCMG